MARDKCWFCTDDTICDDCLRVLILSEWAKKANSQPTKKWTKPSQWDRLKWKLEGIATWPLAAATWAVLSAGRRFLPILPGARVVTFADPEPALHKALARIDKLDFYPVGVDIREVKVIIAPLIWKLPWMKRYGACAFPNTILLDRLEKGDDALILHELTHVWQAQHVPQWKMRLSYITQGYWRNQYENEARDAVWLTAPKKPSFKSKWDDGKINPVIAAAFLTATQRGGGSWPSNGSTTSSTTPRLSI